MKFGKVGQVGLVSAIALVVATLFTACGSLTVGFMFVTTNQLSSGQVQVYEVNSESGVMRTIPTSPFPSGGRNPVAEAVTPDGKNLYVVNQDDNNIVQFGIGNDGKVYPQSTINTPGAFPLAVAVDTAGSFAYTVATLGPVPGCSPSNPCPGLVASYAITKTQLSISDAFGPGSLGQVCLATAPTPPLPQCTLGNPVVNGNGLAYAPLYLSATDKTTVLTPTAITLTPDGNHAYVAATDTSTNVGYLFAFSVSSGALTQIGTGPIVAGADPIALASDSTSSYLYVVDSLKNTLFTYSISGGTPTLKSSTPTGARPSAITLDGTGFLYVANSADSTVTGYSVSSGALTKITTNAVGIQPIAITVDPRHIGYLYTVNFLGNDISGFQIHSDGSLINSQSSPYSSSNQPTAIAGIPHSGSTK